MGEERWWGEGRPIWAESWDRWQWVTGGSRESDSYMQRPWEQHTAMSKSQLKGQSGQHHRVSKKGRCKWHIWSGAGPCGAWQALMRPLVLFSMRWEALGGLSRGDGAWLTFCDVHSGCSMQERLCGHKILVSRPLSRISDSFLMSFFPHL